MELDIILELEEDNFVATRCKAWVFFEMVRYDEAISVMEKFIEKFGELIHKLGIEEHLLATGQVDHIREMPFYCKDADIIISVPSSDSSPASVYEAMACKTPVIISDLSWYEGKLQKDHDMFVVPVRNVEKLADTIIQVLIGSKQVHVNSAYEKIMKNINFEIENRKLENLYKRILK